MSSDKPSKKKSKKSTAKATAKRRRSAAPAAERGGGQAAARSKRTSRAPAKKKAPATPAAHRSGLLDRQLDTILRSLPDSELVALVRRVGIRVDPKKRIDVPAQVARALVRLPEIREPSRLAAAGGELLRRVAEAGGSLIVFALPTGVEALVKRGLLFAKMLGSVPKDGIELILPTAFLVQLKSWEGEDPRSLRALLSQTPFETASSIATHYLGRPSTPPIALSLEPAWVVLGDADLIAAELEQVAFHERRLLEEIEQVGGEVDSHELMEMEREPMRVRGAYGVTTGRRGTAFALEKRGFLFPLHPNRFVIPTEVANAIGAERRTSSENRRAEIRSHVVAEDHLPRRARFSVDPAPVVLALTLAVLEGNTEVKTGVGTSRSLVSRLAQRFGRDSESTALLVALARATGLWEHAAVSTAAPPGSLSVEQLSEVLFDVWRRGGAWDEGRSESELLRLPQEQRDTSPVGVLRDIVLDALGDLGEGQWVPYRALCEYVADDRRSGGFERLLDRWARRTGVERPSIEHLLERVLLRSLPSLGLVDLGGADLQQQDMVMDQVALRLNARGRRLLRRDSIPLSQRGSEHHPQAEVENAPASGQLLDGRTIRVRPHARLADVVRLGAFVDIAKIEGALELEVSPAAVARGLARGIAAEDMAKCVAAVCPLSQELHTVFEEAGVVIGQGHLVQSAGFLWIEDEEIRDFLRTRQPTADLFVDPSPPGGLLLQPQVDLDKVSRRCRALGVEVSIEESVVRVRRSTAPPPRRRSESANRTVSWRPAPTRKRKDSSS